MAPILFKIWSLLFDPKIKQLGVGSFWVKLPRFPLHLWTKDNFQSIGDDLGKYLYHEKSYIETGKTAYAKILVHLDAREGLVASLNLHYKGLVQHQKLDYEGVPFHYC